jgi:UDP-arabinose 4-epimerase
LNILVTGGAGYIGSHVCKCLSARGHLPVAYDKLSRGDPTAVKWGPLVIGRIADRDKLRGVLKRYRTAAVMHFAAFAYVGESVEKPLPYYQNNVAGSVELFETILEFGRLPVIFSSSCVTYGIPNNIPISEDHPQTPINPYGHSKLFGIMVFPDVTI